MKNIDLPIKIIHITFSDFQKKYLYDPDDDRFFTASWANKVAEKIKEHNAALNVECWRHDSMVNSIRIRDVNAVRIKLFPVKRHGIYFINLKEMKKELQKEQINFNIIVHLHTFYNINAFSLINKIRNVPVFITNHGSPPPTPTLNFSVVKNTIKWLWMKRAFKQIDYFFPASNDERRYVLKNMKLDNVSPTYCLGIDFNMFKPVNKMKVRQELGIDHDAFVLGYTGLLYELKGFDLVLDLFVKMKKLFKTVLICLGVTSNDPFYSLAKKEGALIFERNYESLNIPFILNAADIFLNLTFRNKSFLASGGMGIASIEAMACNIPVVSFALRHFPNPEEVGQVGIIPKDESDILPSVLFVKQNMDNFKKGRATALKYLSWDTVLSNAINQYHRFADKYYNH